MCLCGLMPQERLSYCLLGPTVIFFSVYLLQALGLGLVVGYPKYPENYFCEITGDETRVVGRGAAAFHCIY